LILSICQATKEGDPGVFLLNTCMKKHILSLLVIVMLGIVNFNSCSKGGSSMNNTGNGPRVNIQNFSFSVASLSVASGTMVTWTNNDNTAHTVTADDGSFNSGNIASGQTYTRTFTSVGTFPYHCSIHPMMKAAVVVN